MKPDLHRPSPSPVSPANLLGPAVDQRRDSLEQPPGSPLSRGQPADAQRCEGVALSQRVSLFLAASNIPALKHLSVEVDGDTVLLRGSVRTYYEKQLAAEFSRRVAGVIRLANLIEVRGYAPRVDAGPAEDLRRTSLEASAPG